MPDDFVTKFGRVSGRQQLQLSPLTGLARAEIWRNFLTRSLGQMLACLLVFAYILIIFRIRNWGGKRFCMNADCSIICTYEEETPKHYLLALYFIATSMTEHFMITYLDGKEKGHRRQRSFVDGASAQALSFSV